jgi:C4-dicarboxylate-specific signal transduction histidine kinase
LSYPAESSRAAAAAPGAPSRQRTAEEIRRDIEQRRRELGQSVEALRTRVAELTDWRRQVREHRRELLVGAAVAGFVVGGAIALMRRRG